MKSVRACGVLSKFPGEVLKKAAIFHTSEHALQCTGLEVEDRPQLSSKMSVQTYETALNCVGLFLANTIILVGDNPVKYILECWVLLPEFAKKAIWEYLTAPADQTFQAWAVDEQLQREATADEERPVLVDADPTARVGKRLRSTGELGLPSRKEQIAAAVAAPMNLPIELRAGNKTEQNLAGQRGATVLAIEEGTLGPLPNLLLKLLGVYFRLSLTGTEAKKMDNHLCMELGMERVDVDNGESTYTFRTIKSPNGMLSARALQLEF
eukprot:gene26086-11792_t